MVLKQKTNNQKKSDMDKITFSESMKTYLLERIVILILNLICLINRNIKKAFYPLRKDLYDKKKNPYDIKKAEGEIRLVSVDIATRKKAKRTIIQL